MKKSILNLVFLSLMLVISIKAYAQEKSYEIMIGGGIESPLSPDRFEDDFHLGFNGQIGATYSLSPKFGLGANFSFNRFGLDGDKFLQSRQMQEAGTSTDGGNLSLFEIAGIGKYSLWPSTQGNNLYVIGVPVWRCQESPI